MLSPNELRTYRKARAQGYDVSRAAHIARVKSCWDDEDYGEHSDDTRVRLVASPECESYFDAYGQPEGYVDQYGRRVSADEERQELCDLIDRNGCWYVESQWRLNAESEWQHADGVGMCAGYDDPCDIFESCYVVDLMSAALDALADAEVESASALPI